MKPVIALVGRPNVGKSTLFNRLTRSRDALVADYSGLTRDRKYGECRYTDYPFILIDTGGISGEEAGIDAAMARQSLTAIDEADVVFWLVDGRSGLTAADDHLAEHLRRQDKPVYLVVNKTDGIDLDMALADFYALGFERLYGIAASQGRGIRQLMDSVIDLLDVAPPEPQQEAERRLKIGIIGRPNVGKSTLVNRLLGEERVVVYDKPGTTRDSIYIDYERDGKAYTLIDTAGVRRRKNVADKVEKFSIVKTLQAVTDANVVVLVIDAHEGLVDQDLHLMGYTIESGRALVLAVNKWDGLDSDHKERIRAELDRRLRFMDYADTHFISALHGTGVGHLYQSIETAFEAATRKLSTPRLTRILEDAMADHPPPMINGRRIKLRYAHAGGSNPPVIVIHGNQVKSVPASYKRYLEKVYRRELGLSGTPVKIELRGSENPFSNRRVVPAQANEFGRRSARNPRNRGRKPGK